MSETRVYIPSKGRADDIASRTLVLFPRAIVTVDDREVDEYTAKLPAGTTILPHPPLPCLTAIRNWLLDTVPDEAFVMADDDIENVHSNVGHQHRIYKDPEVAQAIIDNSAYIAKEIGAHFFGYTQDGGVMNFRPFHPISFQAWIGTLDGYVGRGLRYDETFKIGGEDLDFTLKNLLKHRIVYMDKRFHFRSVLRMRSQGGNAALRSLDREEAENRHLKNTWGQYVKTYYKESGVMAKEICVKRQQ